MHRADIDHDQHDAEELHLQQDPQPGRGEECQHQEQGRINRVTRTDHSPALQPSMMAENR